MNLSRTTRHAALIVGLLLVAFALRLYRLDAQSLWWDEGISLHLATSSLGEIVRDRLNNIHPPLYFFILKGWLALVGVSAFTGRYLSALASLAQVALVFAAARAWGRKSIGRSAWPWIAAGLMLISALSVIYGQEIRVYALLPVVYLALLLQTGRLLTGRRLEFRPLLYLALVEWIGLHLHYIALFGVAYVGIWGLVALGRRRDGPGLRRWIVTQSAVALAGLPWLLAVIVNWPAVQAEANAGAFATDPVPLPFLFAQVWAFHLTGLAGALADPWVRLGATLAAALVVALLIIRLTSRESAVERRSMMMRLVAQWLIPLIAGLLVWSVRSFSHPRYIVMFAALFIPLAAWLLWPVRRWRERVPALLLALCLLGLSLWGLGRYFFSPDAAKPDMRGVARYLEATTGPGDLIIVPDTDWSLPFEFRGAAGVIMPHLDESPHEAATTLARALTCSDGPPCAATGRVFVVDYRRGTRDWQNRLPFELARRGRQLSETAFGDLAVRQYQLDAPLSPLPACDAAEMLKPAVRFGDLEATAAWVEQGAPADSAVAVALCWRAVETPAADYAATLLLRDPVTGERIAQTDAPLLDAAGAPVSLWTPGETIITYHLLPLPPGTPPVAAELSLGVYTGPGDARVPLEAMDTLNRPAGELVALGEVTLSAPAGLSPTLSEVSSPPLWAEPVATAGGRLLLWGATFSPGPYRPGQTIRVGLTWQAAVGSLPDIRPALILEQSGDALAENKDAPVNGRLPTDQWAAGQLVDEFRDVRVPAEAVGAAQLVVEVEGQRIELGEVAIEGGAVLFERPASEQAVEVVFGDGAIVLVGFDPPPAVIANAQPVPLTLYWQALSGEIPTGYTVFAHLLAEDGRLLAQHDAPPANGRRPTNEWLAGEYVIDAHELVWRETGYTGPARLAVGLYDPQTGARLLTTGGADAFVLPVAITVE
ncbi:membrane protein of unknown function [Candidatus Promineifilum breve]|uniref:Glycosyltransferase RgtA/B/C/D-like domain-containing protein n=1 Tax=Candidatus Promineifilum breve TaxID=1806508 RepID=A0A160SYJ5_9CHLR|nr:hypothetical protein [Candidatus Promineifilum breve]CUS02561.2 membrane protein of unknown function [Candidatus Promineifilum breve]